MKLSIEQSKQGCYTAKVNYWEDSLNKEVGVYLCSKVDPIKEAERWADTVYEEDREEFVVYGIGLGYHIKALSKKLKSYQRLYVIDVNVDLWQQVKQYSCHNDLDSLGMNCKVYITDDLHVVTQVLNHIGKEGKFIIYWPSVKLIPNDLYQLKHLLERFNIQSGNDKFKDLISENYRYNNRIPCENVSKWYDTQKNKAIIIVSGGPSLDKNIELLKRVNEKAFIFATGRTLKKLVDMGIRVDMFCIIDSQKHNSKQIEGVESLEIPFVFLNTASHFIVSQYKGPKFRAYSLDSPKEQIGRIDSGGSVATAVLDLSIRFGGDPIIFMGQDLAYTNNISHCKNTISIWEIKSQSYVKQVEGLDGEYLPTTAALLSYKYWIEQKIRANKGIRFINATEGGAVIEGCEHRLLKDVLDEFGLID